MFANAFIKIRPDLIFIPRESTAGQQHWIVKDPLSFQHYLFSDSELNLLREFDGISPLSEIARRWRAHFQLASVMDEQVILFAQRLVSDNLAVVNQPGFGASLQRQLIWQKQNRPRWWLNPLVIRLPGLNLAGLLQKFDWLGAVVFCPATMVLAMLSAASVLLFALGHFELIAERLPTMQQLLSVRGVVWMAITIAIIKVLHELGHALALRRCGGECFEIGVILLALFPTLYCNASDSWSIPERWKRMTVSFAGIYIEIILASIAAVIWLWTPPSLLNALLFNVVLLCSANTLLVNGNPLLRYDGHYLLADWLNHPNLGEAASQAVRHNMMACFVESDSDDRLSYGIVLFGWASWFYRWLILFTIIGAIMLAVSYAVSFPFGYLVGGLLLTGSLAGSMRSMSKEIHAMVRSSNAGSSNGGIRFSWFRSLISLSVLAAGGWAFCCVPLPAFVYGVADVQANEPNRIYASSAGRLTSVVENFVSVSTGAEIVRLENRDLERRSTIVSRDLEHATNQLREMVSRLNLDRSLAGRVEELRERERSLRKELDLISSQLEELRIAAPIGGIVVPAPSEPARYVDDSTPGRWEGAITNRQNQGCFVPRGEHLLTIVNPVNQIISLAINESDMDFVELGQAVKIRFELLPNEVLTGEIIKILRQEVVPLGLGDRSNFYRDRRGQLKFLETPYRVEIGELTVPVEVLIGSTGRAKIAVRPQTLCERTARWIEWSLSVHP